MTDKVPCGRHPAPPPQRRRFNHHLSSEYHHHHYHRSHNHTAAELVVIRHGVTSEEKKRGVRSVFSSHLQQQVGTKKQTPTPACQSPITEGEACCTLICTSCWWYTCVRCPSSFPPKGGYSANPRPPGRARSDTPPPWTVR